MRDASVDLQPCAACRGTGKTALGPEHQATLTWLRQHGAATTGEIAEALDVAPTAMCNRLAFLRDVGLVLSVQESYRRRVWSARTASRVAARRVAT